MRDFFIIDTTLRDGEQTAGVVFSMPEKVFIAKMLDRIGVRYIEAGIPAMGGEEKESIYEILNLGLKAKILTWNRAVISDVKASIDCGAKYLHISSPVSDIHISSKLKKDRRWVIDNLKRVLHYAQKFNCEISVGAEDASRADRAFLYTFAKIAKEEGASRFRYSDTVGVLEPFRTYEEVKRLRETVDIDIEIHVHNDFGMATANALAAFKAGAKFVSTTINGLGERAGNAAFEEVIMAMKYLYGHDLKINTDLLYRLSRYVALASKRKIPSGKAIVGGEIFNYEKGLENNLVYDEIFLPEEIGLSTKLVIGKHSDIHAIVSKYHSLGIELTEREAAFLLRYIRTWVVKNKRSLTEEELLNIYEDKKYKKGIDMLNIQ
ncbi:homocitrate synthase family protein [Thermoanaerobacterium sp. RBIITD]|uniref:homocitrate synthase family protein n=1 Tax=Thermoanaerobacterium sp. RBIITD TaxID=1550240 RepID=UPI000BB9684D|nr:homocitrate synthase family protein [Thermoanaerobacterium sp. RBIITD]SNX54946.1 homocitrate synthase NifV [Thermoanaerobacterium sp. RBIITD]